MRGPTRCQGGRVTGHCKVWPFRFSAGTGTLVPSGGATAAATFRARSSRLRCLVQPCMCARKLRGGIDLGLNGTHVVTAAVVDVASLVMTGHKFALNGSDGVGKLVRSSAYRPSMRTPAPDYRTAPYPPIYYLSGLISPFSLDTPRLRTVPHSRHCWKRCFLHRTATSRSVSHVAANFAESDIGGSALTDDVDTCSKKETHGRHCPRLADMFISRTYSTTSCVLLTVPFDVHTVPISSTPATCTSLQRN